MVGGGFLTQKRLEHCDKDSKPSPTLPLYIQRVVLMMFLAMVPAASFQRATLCPSISLGYLGISTGPPQSITQPNTTQTYQWKALLGYKDG